MKFSKKYQSQHLHRDNLKFQKKSLHYQSHLFDQNNEHPKHFFKKIKSFFPLFFKIEKKNKSKNFASIKKTPSIRKRILVEKAATARNFPILENNNTGLIKRLNKITGNKTIEETNKDVITFNVLGSLVLLFLGFLLMLSASYFYIKTKRIEEQKIVVAESLYMEKASYAKFQQNFIPVDFLQPWNIQKKNGLVKFLAKDIPIVEVVNNSAVKKNLDNENIDDEENTTNEIYLSDDGSVLEK